MSTTKTSKARKPVRRPAPKGRARAAIIAATIAVAVAAAVGVWLAVRGADESAGGRQAAVDLTHVHGLGVNPAKGILYAAAHTGLYQVPAAGPATRVGAGEQDTMGFTVVGPNHFLASGHPASHEASGHPASHEGGPAHLGLLESTDGGVTWQELSLRGGADFHALRYRHDTVYGYNSTTGQLMVSRDKKAWEPRSSTAMRDFAVDPADPDRLLATTQQGLMRSADGGRTWTPTGGEPALLLDWTAPDALWAVTVGGTVRRSADAGATWSTQGTIPGPATAFAVNGTDLYVSVADGGIFHSPDAGRTWPQLHPRA